MVMTPDFRVTFNGKDDYPKERILSIKTHEESGMVSDSCEIELDDYDGALSFPNTEARVKVYLGYKEIGLSKIGTYFVKEITLFGARNVIKIVANAASKACRSQESHENEKNLSEYFEETATDLDLKPSFDSLFGDIDLSNEPQFGESNLSYMTRIAKKHGAIVKPASGHLVAVNFLNGTSATGQVLPTVSVKAEDVADYSCVLKETDSGGSGMISASWYDKDKAAYHTVTAGSGPEIGLAETFADEASARAACEARTKQVVKASKSFNFSCDGRTDLFAGRPLSLSGFPRKIPENWILTRVDHEWDSGGFSTSAECAIEGAFEVLFDDIFEEAFALVIRHEGGYVYDPNDLGGETKFGISKRSYPYLDIKNLTKEQAKQIYYRDYWVKGGYNRIKKKTIAIKAFDLGVNMGCRQSNILLQRALCSCGEDVTVDGGIGAQTLGAIDRVDEGTLMSIYKEHAISFYQTIVQNNPAQERYLQGWINRVNS